MPQLGIRLDKKGSLWKASCKRLDLEAEARTPSEAVQKCRDAMVLCLRQALRELENTTTAEEEQRLGVNLSEEQCEYEDERDEAELPEGSLEGLTFQERKAIQQKKIMGKLLRYAQGCESFSPKQAFMSINVSVFLGSQALCSLVEDGSIEKVGARKYRIAPHAD